MDDNRHVKSNIHHMYLSMKGGPNLAAERQCQITGSLDDQPPLFSYEKHNHQSISLSNTVCIHGIQQINSQHETTSEQNAPGPTATQ